MGLLDLVFNLGLGDADKLVRSPNPFKEIPAAVLGLICKSKQYEMLPMLELGLATHIVDEIFMEEEEEVAGNRPPNSGSSSHRTTIDALLRKYEHAMMLAHSEDASTLSSLVDDDAALQNCRPILMNAIRDAQQVLSYSFSNVLPESCEPELA